MSGSLAYFITFTCYGARLHGNPNGSVERLRDGGGVRELAIDRPREQHERSLLVAGPASLEASQRQFVASAIEGVAEFRGWTLWALNVRSNHVHVVVSAPVQPERVMNAFKSWATRRLREAGLASETARLWTRHGSTRYLWKEEDIAAAVQYVLEGQGPDLGGVRGPSPS